MTGNLGQKVARNTLYNGMRQAAVMLAAICTSVVVARALGPTNMGVFGFTLWLVALLGIVANLGLPSAATKYISEHLGRGDPEAASHIGRRLLLRQLLLAIVVVGAAAMAAVAFGRSYKAVFLIGAVLVLPRAVQDALAGSLAGAQRYDGMALVSFCVAVAEVACVLSAAALHLGIVGIIAALLAGDTAGLTFGFLAVRKSLLWPSTAFRKGKLDQEFSRIQKFSWTVSYVLILNAVVWQRSEVLFLKWFSSLPQIAFYSIAFALAGKLSDIANVCTNTLMPLSSEAYGRSGLADLRAIYTHGLKYIQMGIVPLVLFGIVLSLPVVSLVYGERYLALVPVLQILFATVAVTTMGGVGSSLIYATDKQAFIAKFGTAVALLNIFLDLILIPRFGAIGAAIANGGAQVLAVVAGLVYTKSILSSPFPWRDSARIYAAALLAVTPVLYASLNGANAGFLLVVVVFGVFVYFAGLAAMGAVGTSEASFLRKNILTRLQAQPRGLIAIGKDSWYQ